jgi:hypothetical protein
METTKCFKKFLMSALGVVPLVQGPLIAPLLLFRTVKFIRLNKMGPRQTADTVQTKTYLRAEQNW